MNSAYKDIAGTPSADFAAIILPICGNLNRQEPATIPKPRPLNTVNMMHWSKAMSPSKQSSLKIQYLEGGTTTAKAILVSNAAKIIVFIFTLTLIF